MTFVNLTHGQAVDRVKEIKSRLTELKAKQHRLSGYDQLEIGELADELGDLREHVNKLGLCSDMANAARGSRRFGFEAGSPGRSDDYDVDFIREPGSAEDYRDRRFRNPWDLSEMRSYGRPQSEVAGELRARALSAISKVQGASDNIRQAATNIIERFDDNKSTLARMCLATSSPAYTRAWSKLARNAGHLIEPEEQRALEQVRAMSLTDSAGGFLVPFQLDPTVIITSAGLVSDIRQVARQVVATGDVWHGVSSAHVSWSWDAEASEVSDDSTTFAQPTIPNYKAAGFVPISIEALEDEQNVAQEVGRLLASGKMELEAAAFITGSGSGQPTGIITALVASSPTVVVTAATDDTFALADVYTLQGALPARYRPAASWLANNLIYNKIRGFDIYGGGGFWTNLNADRPPQLMGRSALEAEAMDGTVTTSGAVHNYILVFGDFQNYVITDRIGMSIEFIPHLFNTGNNRPSGQRGWYAYYRTGADSVNDGAFRLLDAPSAS